ncbi:unnamed protein product, partial [Owenia fusiformis]
MDNLITLDSDSDEEVQNRNTQQYTNTFGTLIPQNLPLAETLPPNVTRTLGIRPNDNNQGQAMYRANQQVPASQYQHGSINQGPQIPVFIVPNPSNRVSPAPSNHNQLGPGQILQQQQLNQVGVPVQNVQNFGTAGLAGQNVQNKFGIQTQPYIQPPTNQMTQQYQTNPAHMPGNNTIRGSSPALMGSPQLGSGQSTYQGMGTSPSMGNSIAMGNPPVMGNVQGSAQGEMARYPTGMMNDGNQRVMMSSQAAGSANPSIMSTMTRTVSTASGSRAATTELQATKAEQEMFQQHLRSKSTIWSTLYICSTCSHGTNSSEEFIQHLCYAPNHPIPFGCIYCSKAFNPFNQSIEV